MKNLSKLIPELMKVFGNYSKWRYLCKKENAITEEDKIRIAERVIAEPCGGSVIEAMTWYSRFKGNEPRNLNIPYTQHDMPPIAEEILKKKKAKEEKKKQQKKNKDEMA